MGKTSSNPIATEVPSWCCKSEDWTVTVDPTTWYITMTPKGAHDRTLIFLDGYSGNSWSSFNLFA